MTTEYSFEQIEDLDRTWTDEFAARRGWEDHDLRDPMDDLALFFEHIPGRKMLDIGCGWGRYVQRFLDQGLSYLGIDHSVKMLEVAKESNPNATFLQGSFRSLPFSDGHFDGIWSCCALSAVPKDHVVEVLQEHLRILKSGGVIIFVMPSLMYSDEEMYTDDDGNPNIYQAHYFLGEFIGYVTKAGLEIVESDYRQWNGSMYVLAKKV